MELNLQILSIQMNWTDNDGFKMNNCGVEYKHYELFIIVFTANHRGKGRGVNYWDQIKHAHIMHQNQQSKSNVISLKIISLTQ